MKRSGVLLSCLVLCGLLAPHTTHALQEKGDISKLVGNWSGESLCVNKEKFPACNDEQVIYRVQMTPGKSDTVTITADKLVNGRPETMGAFDFVYDAQKQTLVSEVKTYRRPLIIELAVKGDLLEGTLSTLPDREIVRRIKVRKDK